MKVFKFTLFILIAIVFFGCMQNKTTNQDTSKNEFDSIMQDSNAGFAKVQDIIYRFPTPGEMFGVIKEGGLAYNEELINDQDRVDSYLNLKSQTLNLGIYIADFAYIALFGRQNEAVDYLEIIQNLSKKVKVSGAIDEKLTKRIKSNLGNIDSLVNFSDEAFLEMFSYCEDNDMHNTNALISAGAYIEGLYIALNGIEKYTDDNPILEQLAQQKFSFKNLLAYASDYSNDENVNEIVKELEKINAIFDSIGSGEKSSKISTKKSGSKLVIGGGKKYKFTKEQFKNLKSVTNQIRNSITNLS